MCVLLLVEAFLSCFRRPASQRPKTKIRVIINACKTNEVIYGSKDIDDIYKYDETSTIEEVLDKKPTIDMSLIPS